MLLGDKAQNCGARRYIFGVVPGSSDSRFAADFPTPGLHISDSRFGKTAALLFFPPKKLGGNIIFWINNDQS
jgi:hypothetical protein